MYKGLRFWNKIWKEVSNSDISKHVSDVLNALCQPNEWTDNIPKGLKLSYMYLYQCVSGLGAEDAQVIERLIIIIIIVIIILFYYY